MNKLLPLAVIMLASLLATIPVAEAAIVASNFNVSASLTSQCTATTVGTPTVDFGVYTAFVGPATAAPTATLTFNCTRGLTAPKMDLDTINGTNTQQGTVGTTAATGDGVLPTIGLNYHLSVAGTKTTTGVAPTTALGNTGSADGYSFIVTGSMPALQAGTCTTGTCGPDTQLRTLTVTY